MRWLGFDLVVLFCDSFFMACMFFISGPVRAWQPVAPGRVELSGRRAFRLGAPFLISIFVLMPIAYYRYYHQRIRLPSLLRAHGDDGPMVGGIGLVSLGAAALRCDRRRSLCRRAARDRRARADRRRRARPTADGVRGIRAALDPDLSAAARSASANRTGRRSVTIRFSSRPVARRSMPDIFSPVPLSVRRACARACLTKAAPSCAAGEPGLPSCLPAMPRSSFWCTSITAA